MINVYRRDLMKGDAGSGEVAKDPPRDRQVNYGRRMCLYFRKMQGRVMLSLAPPVTVTAAVMAHDVCSDGI